MKTTTTTELIEMLQQNEYGGISGKPRVISFSLDDGTYIANPEIKICSTGDGIAGPEIDLLIKGGRYYSPEKETFGKLNLGAYFRWDGKLCMKIRHSEWDVGLVIEEAGTIVLHDDTVVEPVSMILSRTVLKAMPNTAT